MSRLKILESDIPSLEGKTAIITGGSSGIGLASAKILASKGANVFILDINEPNESLDEKIRFRKCDICEWSDLTSAFYVVGRVDIAVANAGVTEDGNYLSDTYDDQGTLQEPTYHVIDTNLRGTLNFLKLAISNMKLHGNDASLVITSSSTAYAPEQSLPIYSSTKSALIGFMRAMRSTLRDTNITINTVAPAATVTALLPPGLAAPIIEAGLPVSAAHFVGLAVVYSAIATERMKVDTYGKDATGWAESPGRWNGRTILTLGTRYTELEGPFADSRERWFGVENMQETRLQQAATDFRPNGTL
ncbi:hypothetical protein PVAG01_11258 [Phlyctema vagabunda]|uniref:Uncharacterized protein n=1 Tax=Phlyctema vagabunda TaxID=108571 RepID=A0ABR4P1T1_9HELO